jgi:hypothetical protein
MASTPCNAFSEICPLLGKTTSLTPILLNLLVSADAIEASLQFTGILPANRFAMGAHPIAELGRTKWGRVDVEPFLHQTFDLIARIDHISNNPAEHADTLKTKPR